MARRNRYTDNGSVGYSAEALKALETGTYGQGRKQTAFSSSDQIKVANPVPVLKGMDTSSTPKFESSLGRNKSHIDIDRARARYANSLQTDTPKTSNDENYVVKRDRYDKLMKDTRLANDIKTLAMVNYNNANQDATVSQEWADEYGAKKLTGGFSKQQFINTLSRRYGLTPEELNDMALTFHSDAYKADNEAYGKKLQEIGKDHSVLGSAGSLVGTIGGGFEGMYNTAVGGITGDDRYLSNIFSTTKNAPREGVKENIKSDIGKGAYDVLMGVADMFTGAATGSAPAILAGNTANTAQQSAMNRGSSVRKSSLYAGAAGALDYITNTFGLEKAKNLAMEGLKGAGLKKFLARNAAAGLYEGGENVLQDIGQYYLDDLINGENSELRQSFENKIANGMDETTAFKETAKEYGKQLLASGAIGFGMGSAMQAGRSALPQLKEAYGKVKNGKIENLISGNEEVQRIVDGKVPEVTSDADLQKAQAQQTEAVNEINRLANQIPEVVAESAPVEVDPENVIYHSGILSRLNKADSAGKMEGSRDTGYYGTGHYFVDQAHKSSIGEGSSYGRKPYTSVDISKYNNLFRADTDAKASKLHDFSQKMMRFVNKHNDRYYAEDGKIDSERLNEYLDDLYDQYKGLFGDNSMSRSDFENRLNDFRNNYEYDFYDRGDSAFTTFMKEHGYNGVDTRGTNSANTERGVVIYDLDEDSILQSNVTDADIKNGLMNTRVRNGNPLFDAETDARIQSEIDSYNKRKAVQNEYRNLYNESKLTAIQDEINKIQSAINNVDQDALPYYKRLVEDENFLRSESEKLNREFEMFGLPGEDIDSLMAQKKAQALESIKEAEEYLTSDNARLVELQKAYEAEEAVSKAAYEQAKANVDNNTLSGYNDVTKGVPVYDEVQTSVGNDGAGSEGILRDVRSEGRLGERRFATGVEGREYLPADRLSVANELEQNPQVFDENTKGFFDANNIPYEDFYENTDADLFSRALLTAKENNENGAAVDYHNPEQMQDIINRGGSTFLTADGTAGGAVEDGNLTAVFKDPKNNDTPRMGSIIALAGVKNGAIKGDCFGIFLVNTYARSGFEPVGRMAYGYGFDDDMDAQVRDQLAKGLITKEPDVYALKLIDGYDYDTAVQNYNSAKRWTQEELDALPLYKDYKKMLAERDALIQQGKDNFTINEDIGLNEDTSEYILEGEPAPREPFVEDGKSRVITKSAINAGIISRYDYDNSPVLQEMAKYAKANNEESYNRAMENVKNNGEKLLAEYNDGTRAIDNDQDVDQAMILLQNLSDQMRIGENVEAERNLLLSRLRAAGTKWGQNVQAFAKWNDTPEGLLINGEKITAARTKDWADKNVKQVEENDRIAEDLIAISNGGDYRTPKAKNPETATSARLDKALREQGYDGTMEKAPKAPKTHEQHRIEVENSIRKELGSVADQFTDNDFEFLTSLVENKVPIETIIDEIEHKLNHGEWYTIDESTPVKKATSSKLSKILKNMGNDAIKSKNIVPESEGDIKYPKKSHATIAEEVSNTLADDPAAVDLDNPNDVDFIATMIEDGVPEWQIEDEISHRLMFGEWYELDRSVEQPKPISQKLKNALDSLVEEEVKPEKPVLTHEELREQVKNTLENEMASMGTSRLYTSDGEYTDADIDYLTNLIENGATKQELAQALNTKMATGTFAISLETQAKVNDLFDYAAKFDPDSKEACEAKAAAYKLIADEVVGDATALEKFEAWRYLAMLGNPKTMLRNFVGNTMFNTLTSVSNGLAGVMEAGADKLNKSKFSKSKVGQKLGLTGNGIQRTKSLLLPTSKDKGLVKAAWDDSLAHRYKEITGSKYEKSVRDQISQSKSVFNSKWAKLYEKATDAGISDILGVRTKYATSLAGYLKANGIDDNIFKEAEVYSDLQQLSRRRVLTDAERAKMESAKQAHDTLEKARDYAVKQADYATFHEDNAVAKWLSEMSRKAPGPMKWLIEGTIPFKKTPANIVRSGEEYSPFGAINSIVKTGKLIYENTGSRKGNLADTYANKRGKTVNKTLASDVIESWSKTLTGSGLMMLGYYLKNKGILNSSRDDERYQDELEGKQNYSITINGHTYTIDWAAPASMALLMGAELSKIAEDNAIYNKSVYDNFSSIVDTVNSLIDPVIETSMMQGIKDTIEAAANATQYNDNAKKGLGILGAVGTNTALNYMSQAIPTLSGQIARVVDPTRRSTDTVAADPIMASIEKQGRKTMNKLPFVSKLNNPYIDTRGQEQLNSPSANPLVSIPYQMLSPGYLQKIEPTEADKSARQVYNALVPDKEGNMVPQRDKGVFSQWKSKVTVDGHKLTPDEMYLYRKEAGSKDLEIRNALAKEDWFNNLDGEEQTAILKKVNTLVNKIGLEAAGYEQSSEELEAYKQDLPTLLNKFQETVINKEAKDAGLGASSSIVKEAKAQMAAGNEQAARELIQKGAQAKDTALSLGFVDEDGSVNTTAYNKAVNTVGEDRQKLEFYQKYQSQDFPGGTNEKVPYVMNSNLSNEEKAKLITSSTDPSQLKGAGITGAYNTGGWEGVWYWRYLQYIADVKMGDKNKNVSKPEKEAMLAAINDPSNPYYIAELSSPLRQYFQNVPNKQW